MLTINTSTKYEQVLVAQNFCWRMLKFSSNSIKLFCIVNSSFRHRRIDTYFQRYSAVIMEYSYGMDIFFHTVIMKIKLKTMRIFIGSKYRCKSKNFACTAISLPCVNHYFFPYFCQCGSRKKCISFDSARSSTLFYYFFISWKAKAVLYRSREMIELLYYQPGTCDVVIFFYQSSSFVYIKVILQCGWPLLCWIIVIFDVLKHILLFTLNFF